ncbi:MAG: hypothetical protein GSR78_02375 [Desulfurococcales archaeon]|nr:hypothetical protein [Desulfurococcales archaeon]
MSLEISKIANAMEDCGFVERMLENLPRWRPKAKYMIARAAAKCIVKALDGLVREVYYVDLSGGEATIDFTGRDVDLIVLVDERLRGFEADLKAALEYSLNALIARYAGMYIAETGKKDVVEVHVVTDKNSGYGRLLTSRYYKSIKLHPEPPPII